MILLSPSSSIRRLERSPRVAVLASGSGSNFEAIATAVLAERLGIDLVGVITNNPDAPVIERAQRLRMPHRVVDHRKFSSRKAHDEAVVDVLRTWEVEWVVMAGWMRIASSVLLSAFEGRILNIHPSLLPAFPGLDAVRQALEAGVAITGCTVHLVTSELDGGPIVGQAALEVRDSDTVESLQSRIHDAEHLLYPRAIALAIARAQ